MTNKKPLVGQTMTQENLAKSLSTRNGFEIFYNSLLLSAANFNKDEK